MSVTTKNNEISIYIHIPFCRSRCYYCSFCSNTGLNDKQIAEYFDALKNEINSKSEILKEKQITSIYFGGGTPNFVSEIYICEILSMLKDKFSVSPNAEITIECNPAFVTEQKLKSYKSAGVNRISIGVQSLSNKQVSRLGRMQTRKQVVSALSLAKNLKFKNLSIDFLLGLESQTKIQLFFEAMFAFFHGVRHISAYMLMIENGTPLYNLKYEGKYVTKSDDAVAKDYNFFVALAKILGYKRYETSNFCKKNYQCRHNMSYWNFTEYLGFGESAHSFVNNHRFANTSNFQDYIAGKTQIENEYVDIAQQKEEFIMLSLRLSTGIDLQEYSRRFNQNLLEQKKDEISQLVSLKIVEIKNNHLIIRPRKMGVLNQVILRLI